MTRTELETRDLFGRRVVYTELLDTERSRHFGRLISRLIGDYKTRTYEIEEVIVRTFSKPSLVHVTPATIQLRRTPDSHPHHPTVGKLSLSLLAMPMGEVLALSSNLQPEHHLTATTVHTLPNGFYALYPIYINPVLAGNVDAHGWINLMEIIDQSRRSGTIQLQ